MRWGWLVGMLGAVALVVAGILVARDGSGDTIAAAGAPPGTVAPAPPAGAAVAVVQKKSPDSDAPATAPAHWLPPAAWVYNHWLPYDEARLYKVLRITREQLWQQLRDDHRTLAQLAAARGFKDPAALARTLVEPRRTAVGDARVAQLTERAMATITQGHLAQHVFFHSLHQFAIPSAAPDIFGVTDTEFRRLRRAELSPLSIGRLHGRSPGSVEGTSIAVLRDRVHAGVKGGAMSTAQGRLLLERQLTQLPRWLDQARYNGPPPTFRGNLEGKPRDYASNPAISSDGRYVAYEAYRQKLPLAVKLGEIAVLRADLHTGATTLVSNLHRADEQGPDPVSAYNPAISGDGRRVVYESSAGNQNFAKRYGRIGTLVTDVRTKRTRPVSRPVQDVPESQSSYNPDVASDRVIFEAVRGGRTVILARRSGTKAEQQVFAGTPAGRATFADPYEASLSRDGTRVAFTVASGTVATPSSARSRILLRDLRTGAQIVVSRANGRQGAVAGAFSADPSLSPDGRFVAFTSTDPVLGGPAGEVSLYLRDLARGRTTRIPTGDAHPLDPAVSSRGAVVAYTAVKGAAASVVVWRAATRTTQVASRAPGSAGAVADGWSGDPSVSADGQRVAFASTASTLSDRKADDTRGIFVRDLRTRSTRLVSAVETAYAGRRLPAARAVPAPPPPPAAPNLELHAGAADDAAATILITDNAFVDDGERPVVHVPQGAQVRWVWRSRQSHSVQVVDGPARFASGVRNRGSYHHRFTIPGTYDLVCSLHAPGMKATVIVDPEA